MPPKLAREELESMSPEELAEDSFRVATAAVALCGADKELFLKTYPELDFREKK